MKSLVLRGNQDGHTVEIRETNTGVLFYAHYGNGSPYQMTISRTEARELREYLDMENVPPFAVKPAAGHGLRIVQEADGRTWVRIHDAAGAGRLVFIPDDETGRLYDWLGDLLG